MPKRDLFAELQQSLEYTKEFEQGKMTLKPMMYGYLRLHSPDPPPQSI